MKRMLVLAVDDDEIQRYALGKILGLANFDVLLAKNGSEAIAFAVEKRPDAVLLDINMPDVNGYEVCRRLRKRAETATIPVIFYTAVSASGDARLQAEAVGANAFLTYPIEEEHLVAVLRGSMAKAKSAK